MAASAAASSSSSAASSSAFRGLCEAPLAPLPSFDKADGIRDLGAAVDCGVCAICLQKIALQETALVKGCEHAYCVMCILRWASYKETPSCPQCKHPFESLHVHRSLDGCIHDYLFEESVCLLLRATWFEPLLVEVHEKALEQEEELYQHYQYEDEDDHQFEEAYYLSKISRIRIGNRRWGDTGYVRGGRREARPASSQDYEDSDAGPSRAPKKKEASSSTSTSASKDVPGRRARRAQKREAANKEPEAANKEPEATSGTVKNSTALRRK